MDPGWNPPRKKKHIAKTKLTAGKWCMREGNTQEHSEAQHAPLGRERPGGEFWDASLSHFGSLLACFGSLLATFGLDLT